MSLDIPSGNSGTRVPALDGIRGLAIFLVLLVHYVTPSFVDIVWLRKATSWGWIGVDLFFVLSGFLLGGILLDNQTAGNYFKVFYLRRIFRIFPLYFTLIGAFFTIRCLLPQLDGHPLLADVYEPGNVPVWSYWLFLQNFFFALGGYGPYAITWSLAVEEQFYLLLPAMIRFFPLRRVPWLVAGMVLSAITLRMFFFLYSSHSASMNYRLLFCRWDSLWIGVLGAWLVRQTFWTIHVRRNIRVLTGVFCVSIAGLLDLFYHYEGVDAILSYDMSLYGYTLIAVASVCLILLVQLSNGWLRAGFSWKPLCWLGRISYAVYLLHGIVFGVFKGFFAPLGGIAALTTIVLSLAVTLLLAQLSWAFLESRMMAIGHRFRYASLR